MQCNRRSARRNYSCPQPRILARSHKNLLLGRLCISNISTQVAEIESAANTEKMRDTREREWIFQFLLNLNPGFDQACGQMLGKDLFPNIDEAFAHIRGKRSHKELKGGNVKNWKVLIAKEGILQQIGGDQSNQHNERKPAIRLWGSTKLTLKDIGDCSTNLKTTTQPQLKIQDHLEKTIGQGKLKDGLCYLETDWRNGCPKS
ncbi:hypothetical protein CK203_087469 [Vitis vinifera]|uniref:Uncharacterized protein n=1 Tax=Vitis vinifera TaxID=29760 RepID=A0A438EN95_VITVI|nr:hypothetical protein CK203_087469 [Vitis vinifera]